MVHSTSNLYIIVSAAVARCNEALASVQRTWQAAVTNKRPSSIREAHYKGMQEEKKEKEKYMEA